VREPKRFELNKVFALIPVGQKAPAQADGFCERDARAVRPKKKYRRPLRSGDLFHFEAGRKLQLKGRYRPAKGEKGVGLTESDCCDELWDPGAATIPSPPAPQSQIPAPDPCVTAKWHSIARFSPSITSRGTDANSSTEVLVVKCDGGADNG